jgi:hypothetical protein
MVLLIRKTITRVLAVVTAELYWPDGRKWSFIRASDWILLGKL